VRLNVAVLPAVLLALAGCAGGQANRNEALGQAGFLAATFNIRYVSLRSGLGDWESRRSSVTDMLTDLGADLVAFQEMQTFGGGRYRVENLQLSWLKQQLPDYRFAAVGDPTVYPSTQPIMYLGNRLELLEQGFFFFSPEPDILYSRPWKGGYPSFCSWARFRDQTSNLTIQVYNVHLDSRSIATRVSSSRLIADRIRSLKRQGEPVMVLGDFNAFRSNRPIGILSKSGLTVSANRGSTYHLNIGINLMPAIDHVLVSLPLTLLSVEVIRRKYGEDWPSDHYPVVARIGSR
jgi:endonuclease/exonuclease/phosphatase family metal-dependent hydrolase